MRSRSATSATCVVLEERQAVRVDVDEREVTTSAPELARERSADAARRAGDDGDLAVQRTDALAWAEPRRDGHGWNSSGTRGTPIGRIIGVAASVQEAHALAPDNGTARRGAQSGSRDQALGLGWTNG
jgi:hypothetical protein